MRPRFALQAAWALLGALLVGAPLVAQNPAPPTPSLAVLPVQFNSQAAYRVSEQDLRLVEMADSILWRGLMEGGRFQLREPGRVAEALRAAEPGPEGCREPRCLRAVGEGAGTELVLATMLTKVSDLIWYLDAVLLDVRSGERVHAEHMQLKGLPSDMVRGGTVSLARRMGEALGQRGQPAGS